MECEYCRNLATYFDEDNREFICDEHMKDDVNLIPVIELMEPTFSSFYRSFENAHI